MALHVGIDLGARGVKVVAGRRKGPLFEIHHAFTIDVPLSGRDEDALLAAVGAASRYIPKARGARYAISGRELIVRYVQVPPVPLWRLRVLMDLEVRSMADKAGEPLAHDYNLMGGSSEGGDETVMLAVVKERFLDARQAAVSAALGEAHGGMPASLALFNAYLNSGALHEGEHVFLVDLGDTNLEVVLQRDGEILFARNVTTGCNLLTQAVADAFGVPLEQAEAIKHEFGNVTPKGMASYATGKEEKVANALIGPVGQLASMLQSSLAFARTQVGKKELKLGRILLSGGGANLRGIDGYLQAAFGCPVERFVPESGLDLQALDSEEAAGFEADPGRYAVALGLAVGASKDDSVLMTLLPETSKKKRHFLSRTLFLYLAGAVALAFLAYDAIEERGRIRRLDETARKEQEVARRARRSREAFDREQQRSRDLNERLLVLDRETHLGAALSRAQELVQGEATDGIFVQEMRAGTELVALPVEAGTKEKCPVSEVVVEGVIVANDRQPTDRLREWKEGMERRATDRDVTQSSESTSARTLKFKVTLRDRVPAAAPEETN